MVGTLRSEQYYLVNKNEKQYFALVTDEYALARAMPVALKSKKFGLETKSLYKWLNWAHLCAISKLVVVPLSVL